MPVRVLIVGDEPVAKAELGRKLSDQGFATKIAHNGQSALQGHMDADAVIFEVDTGPSDMDDLEVCRTIRATSDVPIIVLSSQGDEFDRVLCLKLGADDYIVKPYGLRELAARIEAVVRRRGASLNRHGYRRPVHEVYDCGTLRVDVGRRRVTVEGREVALTRKEFDLLALLASEPGRVFTRDLIMNKVWGHSTAGDTRTLGVHVASLRRKLGAPHLVETVRGVGFRVAA